MDVVAQMLFDILNRTVQHKRNPQCASALAPVADAATARHNSPICPSVLFLRQYSILALLQYSISAVGEHNLVDPFPKNASAGHRV